MLCLAVSENLSMQFNVFKINSLILNYSIYIRYQTLSDILDSLVFFGCFLGQF